MPSQTARLEALASHLLDGFLQLRQRYALLEPMLFNPDVVKARGSGRQARGFLTLRYSLFLNCVQDVAKYTLDKDHRAPSIYNIVSQLEDSSLLTSLKERYARWQIPLAEEESDPEVIEAIGRMEAREELERAAAFESHYQALLRSWNNLSSMPSVNAFKAIRDKITSHTEVRFVADKYQPVDIGKLGVKWGDLKDAILEMQESVEMIGLIVRNAGFAWDMFERQLIEAANGFWIQEPLN